MLRTTFSSLINNPNFRLYWFGALGSNLGTWILTVAQGWLVYDLTGEPLWLGLTGFANTAPVLLFSLYGGVLADRIERRRLMLFTQAGMTLVAFALAALTLSGLADQWNVLALALVYGSVNAFNTPVRQSIVSDLVRREDLPNALALSSTNFQLGRTLGPTIAGLLIITVGPGWCFLFKGIATLGVLYSLAVMDVPPHPLRAHRPALQSIGEALGYVWRQPLMFSLLLVAAVPSFFGLPYQMMLPAMAESVLHVGPTGLGLLQSAAGAGALVGALGIASMSPSRRSGAAMLGAVVVMGLLLNLFGLSREILLSLPLVFGVAMGNMAYVTLNQAFLQRAVDDEMRGRVLSLLTLTTFGVQPLGHLATGALAQAIDTPTALILDGLGCIAAAVFVLIRWPALRKLRFET